ncbi:MAG: hypothetical protein H6544_08090 [Prevotellaceae bacterium]|nr:hypothetical protein [Prevotellaceae bacterium]
MKTHDKIKYMGGLRCLILLILSFVSLNVQGTVTVSNSSDVTNLLYSNGILTFTAGNTNQIKICSDGVSIFDQYGNPIGSSIVLENVNATYWKSESCLIFHFTNLVNDTTYSYSVTEQQIDGVWKLVIAKASSSTSPTVSISNCSSNNVTTTVGGNAVSAGSLQITTTNVSSTNQLTINAPSGFYISENSGSAGTSTSITLSDNVSSNSYYLYLASSTAGSSSGPVTVKYNGNTLATSCTFSGTVTSGSTPTVTINSCDALANVTAGSDVKAGTITITTSNASSQQITVSVANGFTISETDAKGNSSLNISSDVSNKTYYIWGNNAGSTTVSFQSNGTAITPSGNSCTFSVGSSYTPAISYSSCATTDGLTAAYNTAGTNYGTLTVSGTNMTSAITIAAPTGFEVSRNSGSGYATSITTSSSSGSFSETIYVRLAASTTTGPKTGSLTLTANGATQVSSCTFSGTVSAQPSISLSSTALSGFTYVQNSGPSQPQTVTVTPSNLSSNITVNCSTLGDFELSTDGTNYNYSSSSGTVAINNSQSQSQTLSVRLKSGLSVSDSYTGTLSLSSGSATATVSLSGRVSESGGASSCDNLLISSVFTAIGSTSGSLPSGWNQNNVNEGYNGWCQHYDSKDGTHAAYTIHNNAGYIYSALQLTNGNTYKVNVYSTSCTSGGEPIVKINDDAVVDVDGDPFKYEFVYDGETGSRQIRIGYGDNIYIDSIKIYECAGAVTTPTLSVSCPASSFTANAGSDGAEQTFTVSGTNLSDAISVSVGANSDFEIARESDQTYSNIITGISQSETTTIKVRLKKTVKAGSKNGTLTVSSLNAVDVNCTLSGTVTCSSPVTLDNVVNVYYNTTSLTYALTDASNYAGWLLATISNTTDNERTWSLFNLQFSCISSSLSSASYEGSIGDDGDSLYYDNGANYVDTVKLAGHRGLTYKIAFSQSGSTLNYTLVPLITTSTSQIAGMTATKNTPGTAVSYTFSATGLDGDVTAVATSGFELSLDNSTWSSSLDISRTSNYITSKTVYVRMASSSAETSSGTVTMSSTNAENVTISLSGALLPEPTVSCADLNFSVVKGDLAGSKSFTFSCGKLGAPIVLSAPEGFYLSKDDLTWMPTLEYAPENGALAEQTVYVHVMSAFTGSWSGNLSFALKDKTSLTASGTCPMTLTVSPRVRIVPSVVLENGIACGSSLTLTASVEGMSDVTYQWKKVGLDNAVASSNSYTISEYGNGNGNSGIYYVVVSGKLDDGNDSSVSDSVTLGECKNAITPILEPTLSTIFVGDTAHLTVYNDGGAFADSTTYTWYRKKGSSWVEVQEGTSNVLDVVGGYTYDDNDKSVKTDSTFANYKVKVSGTSYVSAESNLVYVSRLDTKIGTSCETSGDSLRYTAYDILTASTGNNRVTAAHGNENLYELHHVATANYSSIGKMTEQHAIFYIGTIDFMDGCCWGGVRFNYANSASNLQLSLVTYDADNVVTLATASAVNTATDTTFVTTATTLSRYVKGKKPVYLQVSGVNDNPNVKVQYVELVKSQNACPTVVLDSLKASAVLFCNEHDHTLTAHVRTENIGSHTLSYQWYKDGTLLVGDSSEYVIPSSVSDAAGWYAVNVYLDGEWMDGDSIKLTSSFKSSAITRLDYTEGEGPSPSQSFLVNVPECTDSKTATVTSSDTFVVALSPSGPFVSSLLGVRDGDLVYVRLRSGFPIGNYTSSISVKSGDVHTQTVALSGRVTSVCSQDDVFNVFSDIYSYFNGGQNGDIVATDSVTTKNTYHFEKGYYKVVLENTRSDSNSDFTFDVRDNTADSSVLEKTQTITNLHTQDASIQTLYVNVLTTGNYVVRMDAGAGNSLNLTGMSITRSCPPLVSLSLTDDPCDKQTTGAYFSANVSLGVEPYTYKWYKGDKLIETATTDTLSDLKDGMYRVVVADANGQTGVADFVVNCLIIRNDTSFCPGDVIPFVIPDVQYQQSNYTVKGYYLVKNEKDTVNSWDNYGSHSITTDGNSAGSYRINVDYTNSDGTPGVVPIYSREFILSKKKLCGGTATIEGSNDFCGSPVLLSATMGGVPDSVMNTIEELGCEWKKDGVAMAETGTQIEVEETGSYQVRFYIKNGLSDSSSWSPAFNVQRAPMCGELQLTASPSVVCDGGVKLSWKAEQMNPDSLLTGFVCKLKYNNGGTVDDYYSGYSETVNESMGTITIPAERLTAMFGDSDNVLIYLELTYGTHTYLSSSLLRKGVACNSALTMPVDTIVCDGSPIGKKTVALYPAIEEKSGYKYEYSYVSHGGYRVGDEDVSTDPLVDISVPVTPVIKNDSLKFSLDLGQVNHRKSYYYVDLVVKRSGNAGAVSSETTFMDTISSDTMWVDHRITMELVSPVDVKVCSDDYDTLEAKFSFNTDNVSVGDEFPYKWKEAGSWSQPEVYSLSDGDVSNGYFSLKKRINPGLTEDRVDSLLVEGSCIPMGVRFELSVDTCGKFQVPDTVYFCEDVTSSDEKKGLSLTYTGSIPMDDLTLTWTNLRSEETKTGNNPVFSVSENDRIEIEVKHGDVVVYRDSVIAAWDVSCVLNYFVKSGSSGTGVSWDSAFATIDKALSAAFNYHETDPDQPINIYLAEKTSVDESYMVSNMNEYATLNHVSIYGGFPTTNTGTQVDNADSYTLVTKANIENNLSPCFKVGEGEVLLSRLMFDGMKGARVITSENGERKIEENLTLSNCKFSGIENGAVILTSSIGGTFNVYDCSFIGCNQVANNQVVNGGALYVEGPYDVKVSSLKEKTELPGLRKDSIDVNKEDGCSTLKQMTLTLLDSLDWEKSPNLFVGDANESTNDTVKGGAVYISGARSVNVEYALFKDNISKQNAIFYGGGLYVDFTSYVNISHSYFTGAEARQQGLTGGALCLSDVASARVSYCDFYNNKVLKGDGAAFAGINSKIDLLNSDFESNSVSDEGHGGGFYATNSALLNIINSKFRNNTMPNGNASGGGAYVTNAVVNVTNSAFISNKAGEQGGGFYAGGESKCDFTTLISVKNSLFRDNSVQSGVGKGAAIAASKMNIEIRNSEFRKNVTFEKGAAVYITEGALDVFSSSFYDNKMVQANQGASAISVEGSCDSLATQNVHIYNSTFTGNSGAQYGCIDISKAFADIVSCTVVGNVFNSGEGYAITVRDDGKLNLMNTIVSNNGQSGNMERNLKINGTKSDATNKLEAINKINIFKRNTIGTDIYGNTSDKDSMISNNTVTDVYSCDPAKKNTDNCVSSASCTYSFSPANLLTICNYGAPVASTRPFNLTENAYCRNYGMTIDELAGYSSDPILSSELVLDEHRSMRGWRYLCLECGQTSEDIKGEFRTFQGAVEGGVGVYEGKKFDLELTRMVGQCSGGELSPAYITIKVLESGTMNTIATDTLGMFYWIKVSRLVQNKTDEKKMDTLAYYSDSLITKYNVMYGDTCIFLNEVPAGTYLVTVGRLGNTGSGSDGNAEKQLQEKHTAAILVESITERALAWVGNESSNFNDVGNWRYRDDEGNVDSAKTVAAPPSPCFDIHIGLENPISSGTNVSVLPTINDDKGECADVYFHPGGSLGQIQKLSYNKAHVEMRVDAYNRTEDSKWKMIAAPLKGLVSGDYMYDDRAVYIRYFNIKKSDNSYAGEWTYSVSNVGESLSNMGMGYALRYYTLRPSFYMSDAITYSFPKTATSYKYYDGTVESVRKEASFRFLPENEKTNTIPEVTEIKIKLQDRGFSLAGNQMGFNVDTVAKGYIIVGNPFMSHIDLLAFYKANRDRISPDIKLYTECHFESYKITEANENMTGASTGKDGDANPAYNRYIPPMQAFFVKPTKMDADGSVTLRFPTDSVSCAVTSAGSTLRSAAAPVFNRLAIRATYDKWNSTFAYVLAQGGASNSFLGNEDSQKLLYAGSIVDVYTHAGKVAVDINALDADSLGELQVPVSVSTYKAGVVTISLSGADAFDQADNLYWNDAQTGSKISLHEQSVFNYTLAKGTTSGRFFLSFDQKRRVKVAVSDTICLGDAYKYKLGTLRPTSAGKFTYRRLEEVDQPTAADTAYLVSLLVRPTYRMAIQDSVCLGEEYHAHGFHLPAQRALGVVHDTLRLSTSLGCDSTLCLTLKVKGILYDAIVYYGNATPVRVQSDSLGNGLHLTGNALAYFETQVPPSLCGVTNVLCRKGDIYHAKRVMLADSADLYIPYGFYADSIVYTRKPSLYADRSRGWETIVLPFTATEFRNSGCAGDTGLTARALVPFNKTDDVAYGDFWLKRFVSSKTNALGFDYPDSPVLEANEPYIVAFPGRAWGAAYSLLGQTIRYTATSASVASTPDYIRSATDHFYIYGVTEHAEVDRVYTLHSMDNRFDYEEAEVVIPPFRVFVVARQYSPSPLRSLSIYEEAGDEEDYTTLGSFEADGPDVFVVYEKNGNLCIYSSKPGEADIYDANARKVVRNRVKYVKGETIVSGLPKGVYLVNGAKVIL